MKKAATRMNAFDAGYLSVYKEYNLIKEAAGLPLAVRARHFLGKTGPIRHAFTENLFGRPRQFMQELRSGTALSKGSLIRRSLFELPGEKPWSKAMWAIPWYGLPAYETYKILKEPPGHRAEELGGMLGSTALGFGMFRPLGLVGSMAMGHVGDIVGRKAGGLAGRMAGPSSPPTAPSQNYSWESQNTQV